MNDSRTALAGRSECTIDVQALGASWGLEWDNPEARAGIHLEPESGRRVPSGERFVTVSVRLSDVRGDGLCSRSVLQMLNDEARLVADGRMIAPDHRFVARLEQDAELDLAVTFRVSAQTSTLQFRYGQGRAAVFTVPLPAAGLGR
jgi:hypothetical protein